MGSCPEVCHCFSLPGNAETRCTYKHTPEWNHFWARDKNSNGRVVERLMTAHTQKEIQFRKLSLNCGIEICKEMELTIHTSALSTETGQNLSHPQWPSLECPVISFHSAKSKGHSKLENLVRLMVSVRVPSWLMTTASELLTLTRVGPFISPQNKSVYYHRNTAHKSAAPLSVQSAQQGKSSVVVLRPTGPSVATGGRQWDAFKSCCLDRGFQLY